MIKQDPEMDNYDARFLRIVAFLAGSRMVSRIASAYCLLMGFIIVLPNGNDRFTADGFKVALGLPGAPDSLGWTLVACGIVMVAGIASRHPHVIAYGCIVASFWSALLSWAFLSAAVQYPQANLTAMVVYGKDSVTFMVLAVALLVHRPRRAKCQPPR